MMMTMMNLRTQLTHMMDCSSLFLVLHTRVAQICIQVYPPGCEKHNRGHFYSWCQNPPCLFISRQQLLITCPFLITATILISTGIFSVDIINMVIRVKFIKPKLISSSSLTVDVSLFDFVNIGCMDERIHRLSSQIVGGVVQQVTNPEDRRCDNNSLGCVCV